MPVLLFYFSKVSICLAVVCVFYKLALQRLTFYNLNRWFLLGYTFLAFLLPLCNISGMLDRNQLSTSAMVQYIPAISDINSKATMVYSAPSAVWNAWDYSLRIFFAGMAIMSARFILRLVSFLRIRSRATLLPGAALNLYEVNKNITPFSFGRAIFINPRLHNEADLKHILHHEYIHVRQHHTVDIIWAELLCLFNWFNPFAWLIRHSIRQNLEFIADQQVLEKGIGKKQYQYLLLKVLGAPQVQLGASFNLSSLKERIMMMNKDRTAKMHMIRFLFFFPLLAVLLTAFRVVIRNDKIPHQKYFILSGVIMEDKTYKPLENVHLIDSISKIETVTNGKGFYTLNIPATFVPYDMILHLSREGYKNKRSHTQFTDFQAKNIVALDFIGLSASNARDDEQGFVSGGSLILKGTQQPTYDLVSKQFNGIKHQRQLEEYKLLTKQMALSQNPYWVINGHTYVVNAAGAIASVDVVTDVVFVNGKRMTGKEVNKKYKRTEVLQVAASEKEYGEKKFGINQPIMELVLDGGKFSFEK